MFVILLTEWYNQKN